METRMAVPLVMAEVMVPTGEEPETHVQVLLVENGVVLAPGTAYRHFFAWRPEDIRFYPFVKRPELRTLWVKTPRGYGWNMAEVSAFVRQEVEA